jgi:hypothetical protein
MIFIGELMTFLLQFFVEKKCISRKQVFNWYNNKDENGYKGFDGAKQMTAPFIRSFWTDNNGKIVYYGRLFLIINYCFRY